METAWPLLEPHPKDVILLVKQYIDDPVYCQEPQVFCPHENFAKLGRGPGSTAPHVALSERQLVEFSKTADKIEKRPWLMTEGAAWLRGWMECNKNNAYSDCEPPDVSWVVTPHDDKQDLTPRPSTLLTSDLDFVLREPAHIQISQAKAQPKRGVKRGRDALPEPEPVVPGPDRSIWGAPQNEMEMGAPKGVTAAKSKARRLTQKTPPPRLIAEAAAPPGDAPPNQRKKRPRLGLCLKMPMAVWVAENALMLHLAAENVVLDLVSSFKVIIPGLGRCGCWGRCSGVHSQSLTCPTCITDWDL